MSSSVKQFHFAGNFINAKRALQWVRENGGNAQWWGEQQLRTTRSGGMKLETPNQELHIEFRVNGVVQSLFINKDETIYCPERGVFAKVAP